MRIGIDKEIRTSIKVEDLKKWNSLEEEGK